MMEFIKEIISGFGGRYFGSEQEKNAQLYTKGILEKYCDKTEMVPFECALESHFQSLKLFTAIYVLTLALSRFSLPAAAVVSVINTIFFLCHFVAYMHPLDFLFRKKSSHNVIGDIEPLNPAVSTIIVSGHMDSVKEFNWWYRLKYLGGVLTILSGVLFPLLSVFLISAVFLKPSFFVFGWWFFLVTSPMLIVYFNMHGKKVVDGAIDNLTGVAMAVELAKVFSAEKLQNTRIRCISFGAEEAGLRGSWAYAKANREKLIRENAMMINLDSIKDLEHLNIVTREANTLVGFKKGDIEKMERSFKAMNVFCHKRPIMVGATDASSFRMQGLPALSIIGLNSESLDPCYHTRYDNLEHLNGDAMEALKKVLIHFIRDWDRNLSKGN